MEIIKRYFKTKKVIVITIICFILIIVPCIIFFLLDNKNNKESIVSYKKNSTINLNDSNNINKNKNKIKVDIKGAVVNPGVYEVDEGTIINDIVNMAGGVNKYGTTKNINLSRKVTDEMVIIIFTEKELKENVKKEITEDCIINNNNIASCYDDKKSVVITDSNINNNINNDIQVEEKNNMISLNNATKEELMTLSGIGQSKAEAIIKYREDNNGFKSIEEIMNINGIGEAIFDKIKEFITI